MLCFIAYPAAIETACKLVSQNKNMTLSEEQGKPIKSRIFVSGSSVMSTKTHATKELIIKFCDELRNHEYEHQHIRRSDLLEKRER